MLGQMSTTFPFTFAVAEPLEVISVPVILKEQVPPPPPQPSGLRVWMLAGVVALKRATAVATTVTGIKGPAPSTCMIVTGSELWPVSVKLTPAIALLTTEIEREVFALSLNVHATDSEP